MDREGVHWGHVQYLVSLSLSLSLNEGSKFVWVWMKVVRVVRGGGMVVFGSRDSGLREVGEVGIGSGVVEWLESTEIVVIGGLHMVIVMQTPHGSGPHGSGGKEEGMGGQWKLNRVQGCVRRCMVWCGAAVRGMGARAFSQSKHG